MLFLSFEDWRKSEVNHAISENPLVECPYCDGEAIWCGECEDGKIEFLELGENQSEEFFTKEQYLHIIKLEFCDLARFIGKDEGEMFFEAGFVAHCQIKNREIYLS